VNQIQIDAGLKEGDTVILSDMSRWTTPIAFGWSRCELSAVSYRLSAKSPQGWLVAKGRR